MVADDVEAHARVVVLHLAPLKVGWVVEVIAAIGECKFEAVLLTKAEEDVEDGAAGCLVRLHEHDIKLWQACLAWGTVGAICCDWHPGLGRVRRAGIGDRNPGGKKTKGTSVRVGPTDWL